MTEPSPPPGESFSPLRFYVVTLRKILGGDPYGDSMYSMLSQEGKQQLAESILEHMLEELDVLESELEALPR